MMELITSLVGTLGVTGVLVWYLYHTTAVSIPRLTDKHAETMDKITEKFSDTLREERTFRQQEADGLKRFIREEGCRYGRAVYELKEKPNGT